MNIFLLRCCVLYRHVPISNHSTFFFRGRFDYCSLGDTLSKSRNNHFQIWTTSRHVTMASSYLKKRLQLQQILNSIWKGNVGFYLLSSRIIVWYHNDAILVITLSRYRSFCFSLSLFFLFFFFFFCHFSYFLINKISFWIHLRPLTFCRNQSIDLQSKVTID